MDTKQRLTKRERRELKKQLKTAEQMHQIQIKKTKKHLTLGFVALMIFVASFGLWKLSQQTDVSSVDSTNLLQVQGNDWKKGNNNATVTLIEYLDFECEACRAYYPLVKRLSEEYNEKILFVSRYFPLSGHKNGLTAALAVEAAGKQGKYWEMYDLLFVEQKNWGERPSSDPIIFEQYAKQLDLNMEQFKQDVKSKEIKDRITKDTNSGNRLGVNSTPTFFLNGKKIQNPRGYEAFKSLLDSSF